MITNEQVKELAKEFPEEINVHPRGIFIEQLTQFLMKIKDKLK